MINKTTTTTTTTDSSLGLKSLQINGFFNAVRDSLIDKLTQTSVHNKKTIPLLIHRRENKRNSGDDYRLCVETNYQNTKPSSMTIAALLTPSAYNTLCLGKLGRKLVQSHKHTTDLIVPVFARILHQLRRR